MKYKFEPIRNPLEALLKKYQLNETLEINMLFEQWDQIVGKTLARVSRPVEYERNTRTLKITTRSDAWKRELEKQKSELIKKLNHQCGSVNVQEIVFV